MLWRPWRRGTGSRRRLSRRLLLLCAMVEIDHVAILHVHLGRRLVAAEALAIEDEADLVLGLALALAEGAHELRQRRRLLALEEDFCAVLPRPFPVADAGGGVCVAQRAVRIRRPAVRRRFANPRGAAGSCSSSSIRREVGPQLEDPRAHVLGGRVVHAVLRRGRLALQAHRDAALAVVADDPRDPAVQLGSIESVEEDESVAQSAVGREVGVRARSAADDMDDLSQHNLGGVPRAFHRISPGAQQRRQRSLEGGMRVEEVDAVRKVRRESIVGRCDRAH
mmetsp:Transcript_3996/g.12929  ORF Transcript_3996/g.12929 Transcript_3996/m.12929 type:complete len:280 (-) Transcript_3996:197-1036(-)